MSPNKGEQHSYFQANYLVNLKTPPTSIETSYSSNWSPKNDFTYIKGLQSHLLRRKMILSKHPEIARLLVSDKYYTIYIAVTIIALNLLNCYLAKDLPLWLLLLDAYLLGGLLNHTLHCCIHDFTHFGGHPNININKIMAALCNVPMGLPSALSFLRYHSDHHNFLGQDRNDPDLPLRWESELSHKFKWYKYIFYAIIEVFYALRPIFTHQPSVNKEELLNYIFIISTNYLIYFFWGPYALLFVLVSGASSIGPHPAAIHILAEHYEFIKGQETYDYLGIWNIFNLDLGYHIEHHDFPNAPWYNLRKIRAAAPEFYQYLPHHTSYWQVLKKFLTQTNFDLFYRTVRVPPKSQ